MELHEDQLHEELKHATPDHLTDNLDEQRARLQMATALIVIGTIALGVWLVSWILSLEGGV